MISQLCHPNVVKLIGITLDPDLAMIVEFCPFYSLNRQLYRSDYILTLEQKLRIALDISRGLHYIHTATKPALIHRDIRSPNIFV